MLIDGQGHGHGKTLVAVGGHQHLRLELIARSVRHRLHDQGEDGNASLQTGSAHLQPRLIAAAVGVDGPFLRSFDLQRILQAFADGAGQVDGADTDLDLRRRRETQSLEELLYRSQARGGRSLHGVNPAIVLVPLGHLPFLEVAGRPFRGGLGFLRHLPRRHRTLQDPFRIRLHRYLRADGHHQNTAVGFHGQMSFQLLAARSQPFALDVNGHEEFPGELKELFRTAAGIPQGQPGSPIAADRPAQQTHAPVLQMEHETPILADLQAAEVDLLRLDLQARRLKGIAGKLVEQVVQAPVPVRSGRGQPGETSQIGAPHSGQEGLQVTLFQQGSSLGPLFLAGQHQFIEGAALTATREDKGVREGELTAGHRTVACLAVEQDAVVVAERRLRRVGATTFAADHRHGKTSNGDPTLVPLYHGFTSSGYRALHFLFGFHLEMVFIGARRQPVRPCLTLGGPLPLSFSAIPEACPTLQPR